MPLNSTRPCLKIAVLVSGQSRGSNMSSLIETCKRGEIDGDVVVVIGTRADSLALERAKEAGAHTTVVSPKKYQQDDTAYGDMLLKILRKYDTDLICLSGYMRILPPCVVEAYENRIMNIHPALLPLFGGQGMFGANVHRATLESGMKIAGCTVHFVDQQYDNGPIILQSVVPVEEDDTVESLSARVLKAEHATYAKAVQLFAQNRLKIENRRVRILPEPTE